MKSYLIHVAAFISLFYNCQDKTEKIIEAASQTSNSLHESTTPEDINIFPIQHASMILAYKDLVIYIDPVGGEALFKDQEKPDFIIITDIHNDHFDITTLEKILIQDTKLIIPQAVNNLIPNHIQNPKIVMQNGNVKKFEDFSIEAVPMYNLRADALKYHEKGRGNGYILHINDQRIYISGDTEDIPEMRALENIAIAFVCMNLPYTMSVEKAADAVLEFKPQKVIPYHYKGPEKVSDIEKFKAIINKEDRDIEVVLLDWYE